MQDLNKVKESIRIGIASFLEDLIYNTKNDKLSWEVNGRERNLITPPRISTSNNGSYELNVFTTELCFDNYPKLVINIIFDRIYRRINIIECLHQGIDKLYTYKKTPYTFDSELLNNQSILDLMATLEDLIHEKRSVMVTTTYTIDTENEDVLRERLNQLSSILDAMVSMFTYEFQKSIDGVDITNSIFKLTINE